ncbi:MAG: hypothetical protein AB7U79_07750 [Candidatus Izemoplasmatales bacterium]
MTFTMWSFGHYLFMISPIILTVILVLIMKNKTYEQKRKVGIALSILAIIVLILRNIEIFIVRDYAFDFELVPLQICHFANFVLLIAFMKDSKPLFAFALLLNLPAAMMSIVFANSLTHYATLVSFRAFAYLFGHILIVSTTLFAYYFGFVKLDKVTLKKTFTIVGGLYLSSIVINNIFRIFLSQESNYFYTFKPEEGTPLEMFFNLGKNVYIGDFMFNPIYLILTSILGFIVMMIVYFISKPYLKKKELQ